MSIYKHMGEGAYLRLNLKLMNKGDNRICSVSPVAKQVTLDSECCLRAQRWLCIADGA